MVYRRQDDTSQHPSSIFGRETITGDDRDVCLQRLPDAVTRAPLPGCIDCL
jgi:hypothetical protein